MLRPLERAIAWQLRTEILRTALSMTEKILAIVFVFIKSVIAATGYAGIALLMAIESACIPLPSELIMPFAGISSSKAHSNCCGWRRRARLAATLDR